MSERTVWVVIEPWEAIIYGVFLSREDAQTFADQLDAYPLNIEEHDLYGDIEGERVSEALAL